MEWHPIDTAPRDRPFLAMVSGLPYLATYDQHGRFIWFWHSDMGPGASYRVHEIDGKRLLEETSKAQHVYEANGHIWVNGFDEKPTHWTPYNPPSQSPALSPTDNGRLERRQ